MVVRSQWSGGRVTGLFWGCRRAPGCEGIRKIKSPELIRPITYDASAQAIFDWESSRDGYLSYRQVAPAPAAPAAGLRGLFGKVRSRAPEEAAEAEFGADSGSVGYFDGLVEYGFVVIENRSLPGAPALVDDLVIGPSGVFVIECKSWAGEVMTTSDSVFVDGRQRVGATDAVVHTAAVLERALEYELKPLGVQARPAILFENARNKQFEAIVGKVLVGGTRGLAKLMRGRGEPVLGPETIVRLAVAADRLLE